MVLKRRTYEEILLPLPPHPLGLLHRFRPREGVGLPTGEERERLRRLLWDPDLRPLPVDGGGFRRFAWLDRSREPAYPLFPREDPFSGGFAQETRDSLRLPQVRSPLPGGRVRSLLQRGGAPEPGGSLPAKGAGGQAQGPRRCQHPLPGWFCHAPTLGGFPGRAVFSPLTLRGRI